MSVMEPEMFVKPVDDHPELVAFTYGFGLAPEGKAIDSISLDPDSVQELDDGDLLIEGWAADFSGLDRDGENFSPGAFERGISEFVNGQASLNFHHKPDVGIGRVLDLREVEGKGLFMRARVDKQEPTSPLHYIYNGIKKGSYRGLSVGGFFKRVMTPKGWRINDMDFTEISVTPVAKHPRTQFAVVAGKALEAGSLPEVDQKSDAEENADVAELAKLTERVGQIFTTIEEGKALPKNHEPASAIWLSSLLQGLSQLREAGGTIAGFENDTVNDDLKALSDSIETQCSTWEAEGHRLAAKIGPIPVPVIHAD